MIKKYIRHNENDAIANPVEFINGTFRLFSVNGEYGYKCKNHWNKYDFQRLMKRGNKNNKVEN